MVLLQLTVTFDNLGSPGAALSSIPITVLKKVGLYGGKYIAKIAGFQCYSGHHTANHPLPAAQIINIQSSKFSFPGFAQQGLNFANTWCSDGSLSEGPRLIEIHAPAGEIDLSVSILQFGTGGQVNPPYTSYAGTWTEAEFGYFILSLDLVECDLKEQP